MTISDGGFALAPTHTYKVTNELLCSYVGQWCHDTSENLATWHHNPYPGIPNGSASGTVIQLKNGR